MAWGMTTRPNQQDLLVLYTDDFCSDAQICQLVAGDVWGPGPVRGPLRPMYPNLPVPAYADYASTLRTACDDVKWDFHATTVTGTASVTTVGHFPTEAGVHVLFFEGQVPGAPNCGGAP
jgi:hypothetical protein